MSDIPKTSLFEFPCKFPLKIVGKANLEFQGEVMAIFRKYFTSLPESAINMNYSKGKKYISLTVTIDAISQEQLDAIYRDLSSNEQVLMVL
jgi:putative lipoic acid-binding regulatory protein